MKKVKRMKKTVLDVEEKHVFHTNDGKVLKNIKDIPQALVDMPHMSFRHHVNDEKNDFANWVEEVMGEHEVGRSLRQGSSKFHMIKTLKKHLH